MRGDEEERGEQKGGEEETRKLNDQLTGFVETKLAGGIKGDGGIWGRGTMSTGCHKQTINTVSQREKQEKEDVTRVLIPCSYSSAII